MSSAQEKEWTWEDLRENVFVAAREAMRLYNQRGPHLDTQVEAVVREYHLDAEFVLVILGELLEKTEGPPPEQVKARREALGLTQQQFAKAVCYSKASVASWETGKQKMPGPALKLLRIFEYDKRQDQ